MYYPTQPIHARKRISLIALALLGTAAVLLLTTDKGREYRDDMVGGAKKWGKKLRTGAEDAGDEIGNLRKQLTDTIVDLGEDIRERVLTLFDEGTAAGKRLKKGARKTLA